MKRREVEGRVNPTRSRKLNRIEDGTGPIVYLMRRDQRVTDNWALLFAAEKARRLRTALAVAVDISPRHQRATLRQHGFMLKGLEEVREHLESLNIPLFLIRGTSADGIISFSLRSRAGALLTDYSPLREHRNLMRSLAKRLPFALYEVDAHNIVPCWVASSKQEVGARTLRPKIHRLLDTYLTEFPKMRKHPFIWNGRVPAISWKKELMALPLDRSVKEVSWIIPGEKHAGVALETFVRERLASYADLRNDPNSGGQSGLSPYLHFGQISAQRVALRIIDGDIHGDGRDAFLEELIVRRELSDNFCANNPHYDSVNGFPRWARESLAEHTADARPATYALKTLERGLTKEPLWNAAQHQMTHTGKMHGYMRMYWAKKLLEWSATPERALRTAIYLNDKYELDGNDPNGYAGIAWSIGGVHDRAWFNRPIFGKVRYMNYNGCASKFDVEEYRRSVEGAAA